jgi:hypothetical protein
MRHIKRINLYDVLSRVYVAYYIEMIHSVHHFGDHVGISCH